MSAGWSGAVARAFSVLLLLAAWWAAADLSGPRLLPGPPAVLEALLREAATGELFHHLGATLRRVVLAFALAMVAGTALGLLMGRVRAADALLDAWVLLLLNVPALVVAVLLYVWLGLTEWAAVLAVALNKLPLVAVTVRQGTRALDPDYARLAQAFGMPAVRRLRHVVLPQLGPYLAAAARTGLSLVWKIVLVVELLGRSDGVGFQVGVAFQLFDIARILSYTLAFAAVVQTIEWGIMQPLEARASRWRQ